MFARKGDRILIRSHQVGTPVRDAEVLEIEHADGSPPYRVRWSDTGHEALFFPGADAYIQPVEGVGDKRPGSTALSVLAYAGRGDDDVWCGTGSRPAASLEVAVRSMVHHPAPPPSLFAVLEDWVDAGLITNEQARAIRQHEPAPHERRATPALAPSTETGVSLVIEGLGYLGGVVMLVGAGILVGMYWADLSVVLRLTLVGMTALALLGAGFAVPDRRGDAAGRLRSVLWAVGVAATAGFLGVFSTEVLDRYDEHALVIIGPCTAVVAGILWWLRSTWLQQLALFVPLMLAAVGTGMELTSTSSSWAGAAMWAVAVLWAVLSWAGQLEPRATGVALGVLGAVLGAMMMDADVGIALGLATAVGTVAVALWERSLPWLSVAAIALLWTMPRAADAWFPGPLSAALTLIVTGGALVGAAVWVARHQGGQPSS